MYEESIVPDRLPGGGGFSIKNLSLQSLYLEHTHGHNIFTSTNEPYPLMRYTGCTIRLYRSSDVDYIVSYDNQWPLKSTMKMYNSMQPQIHYLLRHRIIVTSKKTNPNKKKLYKKVFIPPPTQMKNQWYFQSTLANIPLFMLRTSATSLDHWFIGTRDKSTNITILTLNTSVIFHRNWDKGTQPYYANVVGTQKVWLYATDQSASPIFNEIKLKNLIFLGNTQHNTQGYSYAEYLTHYHKTHSSQTVEEWQKSANWGNPFYKDYLTNPSNDHQVFASYTDILQFANKLKTSQDTTIKESTFSFTPIEMTKRLRYNPYKDNGVNNLCYFLNCKEVNGLSWDQPHNPDLTNENLPLWILLFGFSDFQKKLAKLKRIDTDYTFVIKSTYTEPTHLYIVPINISMSEGHSPYEDQANFVDDDKWFPSFQFQQEAYTDICLSGPGTARIPKGDTAEAKMHYTFHFKWGGELPDMEQIADPSEKPTYPIPNNILSTTSLQNPTQAPETYLYKFDQRGDYITKTAAKRIRKDWSTKTHSLSITAPRFAEAPQTQDTSTETTSEEEEEEDLFQQLNQQRLKQQRLKQRIKLILQKLQTT